MIVRTPYEHGSHAERLTGLKPAFLGVVRLAERERDSLGELSQGNEKTRNGREGTGAELAAS